MNEVAVLRPSKLNISPNGDSLSSASMTLPDGEPKVHVRDWVELYTEHGSAGIYRVTRQKDDVGNEQRLTLTHGLCALEDAVIPGEGTLSGSPSSVLQAILSHQKRMLWARGTVASGPSIKVEYSYTNAMDALEDMLSKLPDHALTFDQSALPWKIGLQALPTQDGAEARLSRNLRGVSVDDDDSELCTRVYLDDREGFVRDGPTIGTWGPVERVLTVPDGATDEEVEAYVQAYLEEHKNPARTVTLDAYDLSESTSESLDAFRMWKQTRVPLPAQSEVLREHIRALDYPDVFGDPDNVRVTMGRRARNLQDMLADISGRTTANERAAADTSKRVSRNSSNIQKNITRLEDTWTEIIKYEEQTANLFSDVYINLDAKASRIDLVATQTLLGDTINRVTTAEINIDAAIGKIELKVDRNGVIAAINASVEESGGSRIVISADKVDLRGYVTASQLQAELATINKLISGDAVINKLLVRNMEVQGRVTTASLRVGDYDASWKSATVVTSASLHVNSGNLHYVSYVSSSGEAVYGDRTVVSSVSLDTGEATINYLGR